MSVGGRIRRGIKATEREARSFRALLLRMRDAWRLGLPMPEESVVTRVNLRRILDDYASGLEAENRPKNTVRAVRSAIAILIQHFPPTMHPSALDHQAIRRYWQWRLHHPQSRGGTKGSAILHELAYLRAALRRAGHRQAFEIPRDLSRAVPAPDREVPTPQEIGAFLDALPRGSCAWAFCSFLAFTGRRPVEARRLVEDDFNFGKLTMRLRTTKNATPQTLPISYRAAEAVLAWLKSSNRTPGPAGEIFTIAGRPLPPQPFKSTIMAAARTAGLGRFELYTLRHAFIIEGFRAGVDIGTMQWLVGQKDIKSTEKYLKQARRWGCSSHMDKAVPISHTVTVLKEWKRKRR